MFRFRLERVLKHRRRIVDEEARRLQELAIALNRTLATKQAWLADIEEAGLAAHRSRTEHIDLGLERSAAAFVEGRRRMLEDLSGEERQRRDAVEAQRRILVGAQREVSVLEKLEERQRAEWELENRRREQKELDEIAGRRHGAGVTA